MCREGSRRHVVGKDSTSRFFSRLEDRGTDPRAGRARGTVRLELEDGEHWYVTLNRGALGVSHEAADADCTVRTDRATLEGMVEGRVNATAALLRGLVHAEGDVELLIYLQRLFPSPPGADDVVAAPAVGGAR
jgi:predicted lipid carrier protein YhbT